MFKEENELTYGEVLEARKRTEQIEKSLKALENIEKNEKIRLTEKITSWFMWFKDKMCYVKNTLEKVTKRFNKVYSNISNTLYTSDTENEYSIDNSSANDIWLARNENQLDKNQPRVSRFRKYMSKSIWYLAFGGWYFIFCGLYLLFFVR